MPCQPEADTRNPVITSSTTSSAPCSWQISRSPALKPSTGGIAPMLPAAASVITQAMVEPCSANAARTASRSL